ncbi:prephenate dehydratase [Leekyejoonella antrihumi]|uniref:Prephenate dehydratase n=1 Tax=Leekyejoonella antrihumi TaxID=1660198 RepID=A0A563E7H3_9MICO|nr:prephenate dehydratase [Leekyejoonella antrihumi]TWP38161.1 prephenate dehydratase [Leekyejoonella antrihumi]
MTRFGYLGPEGTFTQMALLAWRPAQDGEHRPFGSVDLALAALREGTIDAAMVPIENSVEGGVSATMDALNADEPLSVIGEVLVPITFVLAARAGTQRSAIRSVGTHSHAWAQVRGWMVANLPEAAYVQTLSTAGAAAGLAASSDGDGTAYDAAVCAPVAAHNNGLEVLAEDIGDNSSAVTRFVLVARPGRMPDPTGADKTTITVFQHEDRAGGLLELLEQLAAHGINMTRLESRPTKSVMGNYCFSIDFEGHARDERVGEALMGLHRVAAQVRFLGSYPRADGRSASILATASDDAFLEAQGWLRHLRGE